MVIAYDNAQRPRGAITFLLRVETISEICEELKLVRRNRKRIISDAGADRVRAQMPRTTRHSVSSVTTP